MDIKQYKNIYMVGIGGISMSGIAEILKKWGYNVSGSDWARSPQTEWLKNNGIHVNIGQVAENINKDIDLLIYTAAIHEDNPERVKAKELGIKDTTLAYEEAALDSYNYRYNEYMQKKNIYY